ILRASRLLNSFAEAVEAAGSNKNTLFENNIERVKTQVTNLYKDYDPNVEINILSHMYGQAKDLNSENSIASISKLPMDGHTIRQEISESLHASALQNEDQIIEKLLKSAEDLISYEDEFL